MLHPSKSSGFTNFADGPQIKILHPNYEWMFVVTRGLCSILDVLSRKDVKMSQNLTKSRESPKCEKIQYLCQIWHFKLNDALLNWVTIIWTGQINLHIYMYISWWTRKLLYVSITVWMYICTYVCCAYSYYIYIYIYIYIYTYIPNDSEFSVSQTQSVCHMMNLTLLTIWAKWTKFCKVKKCEEA